MAKVNLFLSSSLNTLFVDNIINKRKGVQTDQWNLLLPIIEFSMMERCSLRRSWFHHDNILKAHGFKNPFCSFYVCKKYDTFESFFMISCFFFPQVFWLRGHEFLVSFAHKHTWNALGILQFSLVSVKNIWQ